VLPCQVSSCSSDFRRYWKRQHDCTSGSTGVMHAIAGSSTWRGRDSHKIQSAAFAAGSDRLFLSCFLPNAQHFQVGLIDALQGSLHAPTPAIRLKVAALLRVLISSKDRDIICLVLASGCNRLFPQVLCHFSLFSAHLQFSAVLFVSIRSPPIQTAGLTTWTPAVSLHMWDLFTPFYRFTRQCFVAMRAAIFRKWALFQLSHLHCRICLRS
jgi:hypothetical protein